MRIVRKRKSHQQTMVFLKYHQTGQRYIDEHSITTNFHNPYHSWPWYKDPYLLSIERPYYPYLCACFPIILCLASNYCNKLTMEGCPWKQCDQDVRTVFGRHCTHRSSRLRSLEVGWGISCIQASCCEVWYACCRVSGGCWLWWPGEPAFWAGRVSAWGEIDESV